MTEQTREQQLLQVFVKLADTLVADFDIVELLQMLVETCQSTFDVTAAAILLDSGEDGLDLVASTSEESRTVELMVLGSEEGPCLEAFHDGRAITVPNLREGDGWSRFRTVAIENGFSAVHALPMRLRDESIGALTLFESRGDVMGEADVEAAQALADVATIGILQERAIRENQTVRRQLQTALDSRVIIEQAKGVVAYTHEEGMDEAFRRIRAYARDTRRALTEVSRAIVAREIIV
jgi:transcriptional regulator with GAF, ATPase, and Fis domain